MKRNSSNILAEIISISPVCAGLLIVNGTEDKYAIRLTIENAGLIDHLNVL